MFLFSRAAVHKTKLKTSSFPLKVRFKDVLNHTCILSKHHLEIILHYLNILRVQCKRLLDLFLTTSSCRNRGPNIECPAVYGGNSCFCFCFCFDCGLTSR